MHAVLADSPWGSSIDVSDCVGDSWKNEKSLMQSNPWAADGLQTHSFYVYCRTLCFFSDLCSGIRCASIIRWCLIFIGQYCVVVVLGVSNAYESDDFGRVGGLEEGYGGAEWVRHLGQCLVQMFFRIGSCPIVCASEKVEASLQ